MLTLKGYRNRTNPFFRFLLVGIVNTMVGLSMMFFMLRGLHLSYWWATFIGNAVGASVSFFLNRSFTFHSDVLIINGMLRFIVVILSCYYLAYSFSQMVAHRLAVLYPHLFIHVREDVAVLLGALFYTGLNYLGQKTIVFGKSRIL
ncbi:GtrA family protein [Thermolongibacillus altinsuensis]